MSEIPPPPSGFTLDSDVPPPPPGFTIDDPTGSESTFSVGKLTVGFDKDKFTKGLDSLGRSLAQGMIGGYADEFAAKMNELVGSGTYEENIKSERAKDKEIPAGISVPGEIGGAVLSTLAAAPIVGPTKVAQVYAKLPAWLQTTGLGGLWGALFASGGAEGGTDRLTEGAIGAATGAVTGAALHGATAGVKKIYGGAANYIQGLRDPEEAAIRKLGGALSADDLTVQRLKGRLNFLGPQATIADAGRENVLGAVRGAAGSPGPAKTRVNTMMRLRGEQEGGRIIGDVKSLLGPGDYFAAEQDFLAKLSAGAKDAYKTAYKANPAITSKTLDRMLQHPIMKKALDEAAFIANTERTAGNVKWLGPVDEELTTLAREAYQLTGKPAVPRPGVAKGLSLETWDYVKRGLESVLDKPTFRNELTGKLNKKGYAVDQLRRSLLKELDNATGGEAGSLYQAARDRYASDAELINALREGKEFFRQSPEAIKGAISDLSEAGKAAYRNGAARAVMDIVENTPDQASAARRLFNKSMTRQKIQSIFPTKEGFSAFSKRMVQEQRFAQTQQAITAGSRTSPMASEVSDAQRIAGNIGAVAGTKVPGTHELVMSGIVRRAVQKLIGPNTETSSALVNMAVSRDPKVIERALKLMEPYAVKDPETYQMLRSVLMAGIQQTSSIVQ